MKLMKKIATLLLCVCLSVPCLSMVVSAATPGKISFNDPTTEVGKEVVVSVTTKVDAGVADLKFTIKYDASKLEYISAPNTTKVEDGTLEYACSINQNSLLRGYDVGITFRALEAGTARVDISSYDISSSFDINWTLGYSKVTIEGSGDAADIPNDEVVDEPVDEVVDEPSNEVVDEPSNEVVDEPSNEVVDEPSNEVTDDEVSENMDGVFNETDGATIDISSIMKITLLEDVSNVSLPSRYVATTVTMDGREYPAWQDSEEPDMYILYAQNSAGNTSLYCYDNTENTYQRFIETETSSELAFLSALGDNAKYVVYGAGALILILFILVIVLSVKLYNRDAELDDVYDDLDAALAEKENMRRTMSEEAIQTDAGTASETAMEESNLEDFKVELEEDVILETEDEEDDPEVEVEFYVEETVATAVVEEPKAEEVMPEVIAEIPTEEVTVEKPVEKAAEKETLLDDDDIFEGLDGGFFIDFIDLDD